MQLFCSSYIPWTGVQGKGFVRVQNSNPYPYPPVPYPRPPGVLKPLTIPTGRLHLLEVVHQDGQSKLNLLFRFHLLKDLAGV